MIVGLDIGTCWIRVAIADYDENGQLKIIGTSCEKSMGLRNGNIVNIEAASNAIRNAIENAEQNAGVEVQVCNTIVGGELIEGLNATGKVAVSTKGRSQGEISESDLERVRESATAVQLSLDRKMLHVITQEYIVDNVRGIKDPLHRLGVCLESAVHSHKIRYRIRPHHARTLPRSASASPDGGQSTLRNGSDPHSLGRYRHLRAHRRQE